MKRIAFRLFFLSVPIVVLVFGWQPIVGAASSGQLSAYTIYLPLMANNLRYCGPAPTLVSPANGSQPGTLIPLFQWNAGNNTAASAVRLEVADNLLFSPTLYTLNYGVGQGVGEYQFLTNFTPAVTHYWRMSLICSSNQGPYTATWSFTTGSNGTLLPAPTLTAPTSGSQVQQPVIVSWTAVNGASSYLLRFNPVIGGSSSYRFVTDPQYALTLLNPGATYEWSVTARNSYAYGSESVKWQFTTASSSQAMTSAVATSKGIAIEINGQVMTWER